MNPEALLLIYPRDDSNWEMRDRLGLIVTRISGEIVLWVSAAPLAQALPALAGYLAAGDVFSAALVPGDLPDEQLRVAYEWPGAFVVDADLAPLLGQALDSWDEDSGHGHREFRILRPRNLDAAKDPEAGAPVQVETAQEYASAIADGRPVLIFTTVAAVRDSMGEWFGDLADPRVGGGLALLALSGASLRSPTVVLRSPAALRLRITDSDVSLTSHVKQGRLAVRGYGYSRGNLHTLAESLPELAAGVAEQILDEAAAERTASYGVLLGIEALVDPEVEIEEGSIFEQVSINDVQTLSAAAPRRLTVRPGTFAPLPVPAWCLNASLAPPAGEPMRPTPLVLAAPGRSQDDVWEQRQSVAMGETR